MNEDKLNKSFLTTEAKEDINEMLGRGGESGGSSFTSQVETTEGLTLGKGTEDEENLTAEELRNIKNVEGLDFYGTSTHTLTLNNVQAGISVCSALIPTLELEPNRKYIALLSVFAIPSTSTCIAIPMGSVFVGTTDNNGIFSFPGQTANLSFAVNNASDTTIDTVMLSCTYTLFDNGATEE